MEKPWIGIPTRYHEKSEYIGQIRHYLDAVFWAGGLPSMIPTVGDPQIVREYVQRVQGILLPGSPTDIDPRHYGAAPHQKLGKLYPEQGHDRFRDTGFCRATERFAGPGHLFWRSKSKRLSRWIAGAGHSVRLSSKRSLMMKMMKATGPTSVRLAADSSSGGLPVAPNSM